MKRGLLVLLVSVLCTGCMFQTAAAEEQEETNLFADEADMIRSVQEKLAGADYYQGEADGVFSEEVGEALSAYQTDNDLPVTGTVSDATLEKMFGLDTQTGEVAETETETETEAGPEYDAYFAKQLEDHKVYLLFDTDTKSAVRLINKDVYLEHGTYEGKFRQGAVITWEDGYQETFTYLHGDEQGVLQDRYGVDIVYKFCDPDKALRAVKRRGGQTEAAGFTLTLGDYFEAPYGEYAWEAVKAVGESVYNYGINYNIIGSSREYEGDGIWDITASAVVTEQDGSARTVLLKSQVNLIQDKVTGFSESYD